MIISIKYTVRLINFCLKGEIIKDLIKKNILFGILFISLSAPAVFFMMGLPMILQVKGFDASIIGLFQLVGFSSVITFLLAPMIDKIVFLKNHYKKWILILGMIYIILLFGISFLSLEDNIYIVFTAILLTVLVATFIDIPLNALLIKVFTKEQRSSAGGYKISAYFVGALLGNGIFLLLYNHLGWSTTFIIISLLVGFSLIALLFIQEGDEKIQEEKVSFKTIVAFFKQPNIGIWIFVLSFYFVFISAIWIFMKPYLISKGISANDVAIYVGIYGTTVGIIGGVIATFIGKKFSRKDTLITFALFNALSILILIIIEHYHLGFIFFMIATTFIAFAVSFSAAILFTIMMDYSRSSSRAMDYAIQSSLFSFTKIISAVIAGMLVSSFGFSGMFLFEFVGILFFIFIIYRFYTK